MKVIKRLFLYLISLVLLISLGWIMIHAVGTIPQAKNIFADKAVYGILIPGVFFILLLLAGIAAVSKHWKERYIKTGIAVCVCLILILQFFYLYFIRIYIGADNILALNEAVKMLEAQTLNLELYDVNAIVILLYGLLRMTKFFGVYDLHWIPCLLGMISIDIALLFSTKIVWKVKGSRACFLFLVLCVLNPLIYLWIPGHYTSICLLPFLMGAICFVIHAAKARTGGLRAICILLMVLIAFGGTLILSSDELLFEQPILLDTEAILDQIADKGAVMWQDGSVGFDQESLFPESYSGAYVFICGEKNDLFLACIQMYYIAVLVLAIWGIVSSMVKNQGGSWLFLKVLIVAAITCYLLWNVPQMYTISITMLLGLLALDGLEWLECQRETVNCKIKVRGKWIVYGCCSVVLLSITLFSLLRPVVTDKTHWREFSVRNTLNEGMDLKGLTDDDTVLQTFAASSPFDCIFVQGYFEEPEQAHGGCLLELLDEEGQVLGSREMTAAEIKEEQLYMKCDIISPAEETIYTLRITPINVPEENTLCIQRFEGALDIYSQGTLKQNHEYQNGDLIFSVYKDNLGSYVD